MDNSKNARGAILPGATGRKCRGKKNYHNSKGELLALDYGLKKFSNINLNRLKFF